MTCIVKGSAFYGEVADDPKPLATKFDTGKMRCFLSHNKADKPIARSIGSHLQLSGIEVWFDEWEIRAGDSIPGKLNDGLAAFMPSCFYGQRTPAVRIGFGRS
ncbi:MAG: toll/interleukin-1 receptor domain-containing protein [Acidobacteriaceae bacterium]|nr:toll/interleukin-1 receptor domain-containing protein [Acidobacteriaceae bacterium]